MRKCCTNVNNYVFLLKLTCFTVMFTAVTIGYIRCQYVLWIDQFGLKSVLPEFLACAQFMLN